MTIATKIAAFQVCNQAIAGTDAAPADLPDQLTLFPTLITLPGAGTTPTRGPRTRTYHVRAYIAEASTGAIAATFTSAYALLESVVAYYKLQRAVDGVAISEVRDDGMLRTYAYAGAQYYGFEVRVTLEGSDA